MEDNETRENRLAFEDAQNEEYECIGCTPHCHSKTNKGKPDTCLYGKRGGGLDISYWRKVSRTMPIGDPTPEQEEEMRRDFESEPELCSNCGGEAFICSHPDRRGDDCPIKLDDDCMNCTPYNQKCPKCDDSGYVLKVSPTASTDEKKGCQTCEGTGRYTVTDSDYIKELPCPECYPEAGEE